MWRLMAAGFIFCSAPAFLAAAEHEWEMVGNSGGEYFVVMTKASNNPEYSYKAAAGSICGKADFCRVFFWDDRAVAGKKLPLTDAQNQSQVAEYSFNRKMKLDRMLWKCGKFKFATSKNCFS